MNPESEKKSSRKIRLTFQNAFGFISPQLSFNNAFEVLIKETNQSLQDYYKEISNSLRDLSAKHDLAKNVNPFKLRMECYKINLESFSNKLIHNLTIIVIPCCDELVEENISIIKEHFLEIHTSVLDLAKKNEYSFSCSIDRQDEIKLIYPSLEALFDNAKFDCIGKVDSVIRQSNLSKINSKHRTRKERTISVLIQIVSYIFTFIAGAILGYFLKV